MSAVRLDALQRDPSPLNTLWGRDCEFEAVIAGRPLIATEFHA